MPRIIRLGAAASAIALLLAAGVFAVGAQEATDSTETQAAAPTADPDAVVARVGDETVTERDLAFASEAFASELANVPDAEKRGVTIDAFVNMLLLAQAARDAELDTSEDFAAQVEFMKLQALRNAYVTHAVVGGLTDEEMQAGYRTLVVDRHTPEKEVRARHILVETKESAEQIIEELKGGASFEELAKQSLDSSGQNGGDLGFRSEGGLVKPFAEAAFALAPGEMTEEPVQSEFGWHVIKLEEIRMSEPPALSEVEQQLRNYLLRQKFETVIAELHEKYPVEIVGDAEPADGAGEAPQDDSDTGESSQN